jgi:ribosomal protein S2
MLNDVCSYLLLCVVLCLDIRMNSEADFITEIRYLAGLMRQNCHDASWRMERLLSKVEQGESLDTRSTSIQLSEARDELQRLMRGIESIQKLCELESDDG